MDYLERLHAMLLNGELQQMHTCETVAQMIEQAIRQRDRLLYGVNSRAAELHALEKEHGLLKERYHLLNQKYNQLHAVNQSLIVDVALLKGQLNE